MTHRLRGWLVVLGVVVICAGVVWLVDEHRIALVDSRAVAVGAASDAKMPSSWKSISRRSAQAGLIDLLANSKTPEEAEYKQFVSKTEFDYKQDLDLALASFGPTGKYFLLKGRFDWNQLNAYVKSSRR